MDPTPDASGWGRLSHVGTRGTLRIYLGAAPGVGKTYAMLNEGARRHERGTDVVVGYVETHGRAGTIGQLQGLEVTARRALSYRGATLEEMDLYALLARKPDVALVDELAHTNVPGSTNEKRWEDVESLLDAGIDVISTLNIQHLESLNDVTLRITGVQQRETVPDAVVRRADQIELVDMSPEALRRRMAHGNIYPAERIDAALGNYFRPGNLGALRELALLWVADRVEDSLHDYLVSHGIADAWETRERIVVAVTGAPGGEAVIRRASRLSARSRGDLVGVRVVPEDGLSVTAGPNLDAQRKLLEELGGAYHEVVGGDVPAALLTFARGEKATQIVLGASRGSLGQHVTRGSVVTRVLRKAGDLDVHVISGADLAPTPNAKRPRRQRSISARRRLAALAAAVVILPSLTAVELVLNEHTSLSTTLLVFLGACVLIAAIGGTGIGLVTAIAAFLLTNWFFVPPTHTFTVGDAENLVALFVFVTVTGTVSTLVNRTAQRSQDALRARAEAEALARTTATLVGEASPMASLVAQIRSTFEFAAAAVMERSGDVWAVVASAGGPVPQTPSAGTTFPLDRDGLEMLVVTGRTLDGDARRILRAFADQLAVAIGARRLQEQATHAQSLADTDALRTALLRAVSHDLRTPLSSIKASVTSLLQSDVGWSDADRIDFLSTIDEETDRLNHLVGNLLDMSRVQTGALTAHRRPTAVEEVIGSALRSVSQLPDRVSVDLPPDLPLIEADPVLLERAVANLVANAVAWSPPSSVVRVGAGAVGGGRVHLFVADHGPGIPLDQRALVFEPFQRLGDQPKGTGVGLGLALSKGFVTAMGGTLTIDDTPGGGCTMIIDLAESTVDTNEPEATMHTALAESTVDTNEPA